MDFDHPRTEVHNKRFIPSLKIDWKPFHRSFIDNLRELMAAPRLRFVRQGSASLFEELPAHDAKEPPRAQELSFVLHLLAFVLLLFPLIDGIVKPDARSGKGKTRELIHYAGWVPLRPAGDAEETHGGGIGGNRDPVPPRQGGQPPFSWFQQTPPSIIRNPNPALPAEPTVVGPPEIQVPETKIFGDPLSRILTDSQGPGGGNGFGNDCCGGVGSGTGRGAGSGEDWGVGGPGKPSRGGRVKSHPECKYCPTPTFTEEARKAKHQGNVLLRILVLPNGRATNISVARGLGMGLDEQAMQAVRAWEFKPAIGPGGKPVAEEIFVEVMFRLF